MTVSAREALAVVLDDVGRALRSVITFPHDDGPPHNDGPVNRFVDAIEALIAAMIAESKQGEDGCCERFKYGSTKICPDCPRKAPSSAPAPQAGEEGPIVVRLFMLVDNMSAGLTKAHWRPEAIKDAEATIFAAIDALRAAERERDEARADANRNSAIAREIGISRFEADAELITLRSARDRAVAVLKPVVDLVVDRRAIFGPGDELKAKFYISDMEAIVEALSILSSPGEG